MENKKILLVDDNPAVIQVMAKALAGLGHLLFATSGEAGLRQARDVLPDLVLLDAEMPGMSGYDVCKAMKADPTLSEIPVIFVTGHSEQEQELKGLAAGAMDFLSKPVSEPLLVARVKTQLRVKHLTDELKRIAMVDALTETLNRRAFDMVLAREWKRCVRSGEPLSLLMVDVDHFKLFNDHYGHPFGDACLRSVAQALKQSVLRPGDRVARYGGEEFTLLLPQTSRDGASVIAQRVMDAVGAIHIPHAHSPTADHVTVSIGLSSFDSQSPGWTTPDQNPLFVPTMSWTESDLVAAADKALYAAKHAGRAQTWWLDIADEEPASPACGVQSHLPAPCERLAA